MRSEKLKILIKAAGAWLGLFLPTLVYAQADGKGFDIDFPKETPVGAIPATVLGEVIGNALTIAIFFAGLLTVVYLIWGGIDWLTSGGEKANYQAARDRITHAFIGLGIVVGSWLIIKILEAVLNIKILTDFTLPSLYTPK